VGDTTLARYENGRWTYHTRQALQVPRGYVPPRDRLNRDSVKAGAAAATGKDTAKGVTPA